MSNYPPERQQPYQDQPQFGQQPNPLQSQVQYGQPHCDQQYQQGYYDQQRGYDQQQPYYNQQQAYYGQQHGYGQQQMYSNQQQPYYNQQQTDYEQQQRYNQQQYSEQTQGYYYQPDNQSLDNPSGLRYRRRSISANAHHQGSTTHANSGNALFHFLGQVFASKIAVVVGGVLALVTAVAVLVPVFFHQGETKRTAPPAGTTYVETWMPVSATYSYNSEPQFICSFNYNSSGWIANAEFHNFDGYDYRFDFSTWREDGKPVQFAFVTDGQSAGDCNYEYNEEGNMTAFKYGEGGMFYSYEYDEYKRISRVAVNNFWHQLIGYRLMEYGADGKVTKVIHMDSEGNIQERPSGYVSYTYDTNGNITERMNTGLQRDSYTINIEYAKINVPAQSVNGYELAALLVGAQMGTDFWY